MRHARRRWKETSEMVPGLTPRLAGMRPGGGTALGTRNNATTPAPDPEVLHAAVEASGEAIMITSAELDEPGPRIEYVNPAFTRMTG